MRFRLATPLAVAACVLSASTLACMLSAHTAAAQAQQVQLTMIPEARLDLIAGKNTSLQGGLGVTFPVSTYVGIGATLGAGISRTGFGARSDLYGRFSLDPYRQYYWEPYVGGGVTTRYDAGGPGTRSYLLGVIGFNGPDAGGVSPGFELGVGGGVRLGITLRWGQSHIQPAK